MTRALVVDDEENIRLVLRTLLKKHGYEVATAGSAEEALEVLEGEPADFVLSQEGQRTEVRVRRDAELRDIGLRRAGRIVDQRAPAHGFVNMSQKIVRPDTESRRERSQQPLATQLCRLEIRHQLRAHLRQKQGPLIGCQ